VVEAHRKHGSLVNMAHRKQWSEGSSFCSVIVSIL